jgi:hypothetical protein
MTAAKMDAGDDEVEIPAVSDTKDCGGGGSLWPGV